MTLKKQSIRSNMHVYADNELISKEDLIEISKTWSEAQENMFRKCLKQGVFRFKVKGVTYKIDLKERTDIDSAGNRPKTVPPLPGERTF
jgi:hypothetical protein|tara:strand:- start:463 stop:729 length:267 start_codon:yes stop_codon:yes gene_type:complete